MQKKLVLLTGYNQFFGQTRKPWVSINTRELISNLESNGFEVNEYPFHKIINSEICLRDSIVFYTFSQRENLRPYIRDVIFTLQNNNNIVIPSFELLLCHENKGYQEILKKQIGLNNLPSFYFSSKRELRYYTIDYPMVLKTLKGSNGKGVFLVNSEAELHIKIRQIELSLSLFVKLDLFRRKYFRVKKSFPGYDYFDSSKDHEEYKDYITPESSFVLQKFIAGLECDYRISVLGEHYYIAKRLTRDGDFRASGAKRFVFDLDNVGPILDYAKKVFDKFDVPCLSIDVGEKENQFYLFEFQALHFGINPIIRGKGYYHVTSEGWKFIEHKAVFENELSSALISYLHKKELL